VKIILRLGLCPRPLADRLSQDPALARLTGAKPNAAVGFVFHRWVDGAPATA